MENQKEWQRAKKSKKVLTQRTMKNRASPLLPINRFECISSQTI